MKTQTVMLVAGVVALLVYRARNRAASAPGRPQGLALGADAPILTTSPPASPGAPLPMLKRADDVDLYTLEAW